MKLMRVFLLIILILSLAGLATGQVEITHSRTFSPYLQLGRATPGSTVDTLYNPSGVLTYNGTPITMGGGTGLQLQSSTPGTAQTGHGNISGTFIAGAFSGPLAGNASTATKSTNLIGGNGTTLLGAVPYQSGTDTTAFINNVTTTRKFLRQVGDNTNSTVPVFDTLQSGDIPANAANTSGTAAGAALWGLYASITGPSQAHTYTFPDSAATLLYDGKASGTFGTGGSALGSVVLKNASNTNAFTLQPGVTGAALSWTLPITAPGGNNYLLNAQTTGALGYTDPATFALVGQTMNIGTTAVAINRASAALALTGITSIDGSSSTCVGNAGTVTNGVYTTANNNTTRFANLLLNKGGEILWNSYYNGGYKYIAAGEAYQIHGNDTVGIDFATAPTGSADAALTFTSRFIVGTDGVCTSPMTYSNVVIGSPVLVSSAGAFGVATSSLKYKTNIINMEDINWIYKLQLKSFIYKNDKTKTKQYGMIAEEVAKIKSEIVFNDKEGKPDRVRYEQLIPVLVKAVQEQNKRITDLEAKVKILEAKVDK